MAIGTILRLIGGLFLILSNAFFVGTEFALTRLRQYDEAELKGDSRLDRAWEMTEELEIYLTGCQVGITFSSVLLGVVAEPAVTAVLQPVIQLVGVGEGSTHAVSVVVGVVLLNFVHTVWAEQTPTYLGIERAKLVVAYNATLLYYWTKLTYPFIYLGDKLTKGTLGMFGITIERSWMDEPEASRGDLKRQMAELLESSDVPADRQEEVMMALEIGEIPTRDIMVPSEEVVPLSTNRSFAENLDTIREHMRVRYPLIGESLEDFKGILYASEILSHIERLQAGEITLDDLDRTNMTVPADLPVSQLIDRFQSEYQELALVTEHGEMVGLVTLTDALEAIVGSAEDPLDLEVAS